MPGVVRCGRKPSPTFVRLALKPSLRSANREAVAYFEQALAALQHLPQSRTTLKHAIDLRLDLRNALMPSMNI